MAHRNSRLDKPKTSSLRRSPRFLSPKTPDITPNDTHLHRISALTSSPPRFKSTSTRKPNKNVPKNCPKSLDILKYSNNGSEICAKSRNGSKRKSNFGNKIVKNNGVKGSRKLSGKVTSLVDGHMLGNDEIVDGSVKCNTRSKRRSLKKLALVVRNDNLVVDNVAFPVTPIGVVEKKLKGRFRNDNVGEMIDSGGRMLENAGRRITRSCSKLMAMNVEGRRVEEENSKGVDLFGDRGGGWEMRDADTPVRIAGGRHNVRGSENGDEFSHNIVFALEMGKCDSLIACVTPGNRKVRRYRMKDERVKVGKMNDSCGGVVHNLDKRIARSASKRMAGETGLSGHSLERQRTCTPHVFSMVECDSKTPCVTPRNGKGKGGRMKDNREKVGKTDDLCVGIDRNFDRRITRSASKRMAEQTDLYGQNVERRSLCTPRALRMVERDSLPPCVTPGKGNRRRHGMKDKHGKLGKTDYSCVEMVQNLDMRVTRSASKSRAGETDVRGQNGGGRRAHTSSKAVVGLGAATKAEKQIQGSFKNCRNEPRNRVQRDSNMTLSSTLKGEETSMADIRLKKKESCIGGQDAVSLFLKSGELERKTNDMIEGIKAAGVKRKRKQTRLLGTNHGWTREQELALQTAYFAAKPSPHFWKKVSKLVPGKSAQDCFDKMHSDNLTPLSTRRSSRVKKQNSPSVLSYSESKLFKSVEKKSKRTCKTKRKSHRTRKAVRHLLQKSCHVKKGDKADLFSVLEPTVNPSVEAVQFNAAQLTQKNLLGTPGSYSKYSDRSSSGHKNRLSRFSGIRKSPLTSPLVLKKVKNLALHDKYVDQLHIRDCKRKVASTRDSKFLGAQNPAQTEDVIRAAKDSLVSEARDVIKKFRHSQANLVEAYSDSEEAFSSDESEDEAVLQ